MEEVRQPADSGARQTDTDAISARFAKSAGTGEFPRLWLDLLCAQLPATRSGLVLLGTSDRGPFTPAAVWPDPGRDLAQLTPAAERTLRERRGIAVRRDAGAGAAEPAVFDLTYPLLVDDALHGAVVIEVPDQSPDALQQALRQIHWRVASLELELRLRERDLGAAAERRVSAMMDLVSISEVRIWFPSDDETKIVVAHQALAQQQGAPEICTVPIPVQGRYEAAQTIERPPGADWRPSTRTCVRPSARSPRRCCCASASRNAGWW